ncbi:hypothetical protein ZWY2020_051954 [Hordeum vulgare]|nr:hypothetical protein ZWY2020_051954 [Hordeum vulgare]
MLQLVAQQFENTLVRILLAAGAVSFVLALSSSAGALMILPFVEALVIFLILVVNAAVGAARPARRLEAAPDRSDHAAVLAAVGTRPPVATCVRKCVIVASRQGL